MGWGTVAATATIVGISALGGVAAIEFNQLARPRADDVDGLFRIAGVNGQGSEGGGRNGLSHAPAIAEFDLPFAHEESHSVLEDRHGANSRLPDVRVLVVARGIGCCRQGFRLNGLHDGRS